MSNQSRSTIWNVFAVIILVCSAGRSDAGIINGGFETGDFTGWTVVDPHDTYLLSDTSRDASDWQLYTFKATASSNSTVLTFSGAAGATFWGLDDVTVRSTAVPEPSTFALVGLGGLGMAFGAYRRRSCAV
jgi:hypothetical protein